MFNNNNDNAVQNNGCKSLPATYADSLIHNLLSTEFQQEGSLG